MRTALALCMLCGLLGKAYAQTAVVRDPTTGTTTFANRDGSSTGILAPKSPTSSTINTTTHHVWWTYADGSTADIGQPCAPASALAMGCVIIGSGLSVDSFGNLSAVGVPGPTGATGSQGATGAAGSVPFYNASGLISGTVKCWQGTATTIAGGTFSANYSNAGFTAAPIVAVQAISTSQLLGGLLYATNTAPTTTNVAGAVSLAGIGGLGGAGSVVQIRACGP